MLTGSVPANISYDDLISRFPGGLYTDGGGDFWDYCYDVNLSSDVAAIFGWRDGYSGPPVGVNLGVMTRSRDSTVDSVKYNGEDGSSDCEEYEGVWQAEGNGTMLPRELRILDVSGDKVIFDLFDPGMLTHYHKTAVFFQEDGIATYRNGDGTEVVNIIFWPNSVEINYFHELEDGYQLEENIDFPLMVDKSFYR